MVTSAHRVRYTYAQYRALEAASNVKHEFLDGQIFAMAGGSREHAALAAAVVGLIYGQLMRGPCRAHSSDLRVRIPGTGLATYPDVTIVCGEPRVDEDDPQAVTNPTLVVEVLSDSTAEYDRGEKFDHYKTLGSLQQYVLVSQGTKDVVVFTRGSSGWTEARHGAGDDVHLSSVSATLNVDDLYAGAEPG
ncbi:MAG: Uma2 family endonuclease [Nannocystaceae bacterium]|nr:Uma2 family endonuclease [bacterium]